MSKQGLFGLCAAILLLTAVAALSAEPQTPAVDQRQENQQRRIGQGVASGELTPGETVRLEKEQAGIRRAEERAKADGKVTPKERARLKNRQDKASRDIYRLKHNRRKVE
jgi:hypothetical protein